MASHDMARSGRLASSGLRLTWVFSTCFVLLLGWAAFFG